MQSGKSKPVKHEVSQTDTSPYEVSDHSLPDPILKNYRANVSLFQAFLLTVLINSTNYLECLRQFILIFFSIGTLVFLAQHSN